MIPVLYEVDERLFNTNGLGRLSDAIQCAVTEERNGQFELYLQYPVDGEHYEELAHSRLIFAVPADGVGAKPFRIYRISKPMNGRVEVFAEHISYQLSQCIVKPFEATGINQVFAALKANSVIEYPFNYDSSGISTSKEFSLTAPASVRSIMGGQDGSIIDTFGGEWEWGTAASQFMCTLHQSRGLDRGVSIRYGKNLLDLTQEENIQNTVTGIVPFWKGQNEAQEEDYVFLEDGYILKDGISESYPYQRLELVDLSQQFDGKPNEEELLLEAQAYIASHDIGKPTVNLTISFVALWQTEEYKDIAPLERVNLCDTVTVEFEKLGVSVSAKVVKTVYNVLLERYDSIELGETKGTLAKTVQQSIDTVKKDIEDAKSTYATKSMVNQALDEASAKITGGLGGYVVINTNADGEPQEILVMNTPDKTTATSVMRINRNGIGFATGPNAYDGPFNSAWTIDGSFNGQFIATGSLVADKITSGMLTSVSGDAYFDLDNDKIVCSELLGRQKSTEGDVILGSKAFDIWDPIDATYSRGVAVYRDGYQSNGIIFNPHKTKKGLIESDRLSLFGDKRIELLTKGTMNDVVGIIVDKSPMQLSILQDGYINPRSPDSNPPIYNNSGNIYLKNKKIYLYGDVYIKGDIHATGYIYDNNDTIHPRSDYPGTEAWI